MNSSLFCFLFIIYCTIKTTAVIEDHCENMKELVIRQVKNVLKDKSVILSKISSADYIQKHPMIYNASVGQHVRHILDHFSALVSSTTNDNGVADYDSRQRNTAIETSVSAAREKMELIEKEIDLINFADIRNIKAQFMIDKDGNTISIDSNFERELSFCAHHALHHMSFINLMLTNMNYTIDKDIGKAPSTKNFEK